MAFRAFSVSSLSPFSSIIGATCAMPSRVNTPRMVSTGANSPGMRRMTETTRRKRTSQRVEVIGIQDRGELSRPAQVVCAVRQIAKPLAGDLKDRVADGRLHRRGAVVAHAQQPVRGRKEPDVDRWRILVDARQRERVEVVLDDAAVLDGAGLVHRIVVEPGDLAFDLLLH